MYACKATCYDESEVVSFGSGQRPGQLPCFQDPCSSHVDEGSPNSDYRVGGGGLAFVESWEEEAVGGGGGGGLMNTECCSHFMRSSPSDMAGVYRKNGV